MEAIQSAIDQAGGQTKLAARIQASPAMVWQWAKDKRPVAAHYCVRIERVLGISRRDLRPSDWGDIWPELIDAEHPWPPVAADTQENTHAAA